MAISRDERLKPSPFFHDNVLLMISNLDLPPAREFVKFRLREDRPTYIGQRFKSYLTGTVLDVGCDQAVLKKILGTDRYVGVGMTEEADVKVNLETASRLPFEDRSWDTVLCLDTLEHLNDLHGFCSEIFRIAKEHVIISLPNCWSQARKAIAKGSGPIWHYGLAAQPPKDRHKWFFNTEEACSFFQGQLDAVQFPIDIVELVALENKRPLVNRIWRRLKYPSRRKYLNLYPHTVVCVYSLKDVAWTESDDKGRNIALSRGRIKM